MEGQESLFLRRPHRRSCSLKEAGGDPPPRPVPTPSSPLPVAPPCSNGFLSSAAVAGGGGRPEPPSRREPPAPAGRRLLRADVRRAGRHRRARRRRVLRRAGLGAAVPTAEDAKSLRRRGRRVRDERPAGGEAGRERRAETAARSVRAGRRPPSTVLISPSSTNVNKK